MNTPGKDYTHHSWLAAAALIAVLVAVSFIPPQSVGGVKLRRANILSDLLSFDDAEAAEPAAEPALFDEEEFHIDMAAVAERIEADTCGSDLIPGNSCGMAQATVLGVSTFVYAPYCIFNIVSPLMSLLVAAVGWNIKRKK